MVVKDLLDLLEVPRGRRDDTAFAHVGLCDESRDVVGGGELKGPLQLLRAVELTGWVSLVVRAAVAVGGRMVCAA